MKQETYRQLAFVLSLLGLLVAGYLLATNVGKTPLVCGLENGCSVVTTSPYAYIFGIPVAAYGVAFYLSMLTLSVAVSRNPKFIPYMLALSAFGFLFSGYLTYVQRYLIKAFCLWCLSSAIIATLLFVVSFLLFLATRRPVTKGR